MHSRIYNLLSINVSHFLWIEKRRKQNVQCFTTFSLVWAQDVRSHRRSGTFTANAMCLMANYFGKYSSWLSSYWWWCSYRRFSCQSVTKSSDSHCRKTGNKPTKLGELSESGSWKLLWLTTFTLSLAETRSTRPLWSDFISRQQCCAIARRYISWPGASALASSPDRAST